MLRILLLISCLTSGTISTAAERNKSNLTTYLEKFSAPLIACCSIPLFERAQRALTPIRTYTEMFPNGIHTITTIDRRTGVEQVLLSNLKPAAPVETGLNCCTNTLQQLGAAAPILLAPLAGHLAIECCTGRICQDPIESCCPGVREGACMPMMKLLCKGPMAAACFGTMLEFGLLLNCSIPSGYTLFAASCFGHCAADYCLECAAKRCCNNSDQKED